MSIADAITTVAVCKQLLKDQKFMKSPGTIGDLLKRVTELIANDNNKVRVIGIHPLYPDDASLEKTKNQYPLR